MKSYYETKLGKLYHGDCLEIMPELEPVDLVVTSPPYDNLRKYEGFEFNFKRIARGLFQTIKKGGVLVWVVGDQTINGSETGSSFKQALYFKYLGFNIHDTMIYKSQKPPLTHNRYEQSFEYMFILSKNRPKTFNPIMEMNKFCGCNALSNADCASGKDNSAMRQRPGVKAIKQEGIINNIWEYKTGCNQTTRDTIAFQHPAIFPESLAQDHIVSWSNPEDIVLDPMSGSGTTGKMCEINNRRWIGIEISEKYCEIAAKRIEQEARQLKLF